MRIDECHAFDEYVAAVVRLHKVRTELMVRAKQDPFNRMPEKHFLKPQFGCPVLK
jgi:hypothetical protein